jgi:hypothetical protein
MQRKEHTGQIVGEYFNSVVMPRLESASDRVTSRGDLYLSYYDFPDARLTAIDQRGTHSRYVRFFGLAEQIPREELDHIGVLATDQYPDLVVAFPSVPNNFGSMMRIVPSELRDHARTMRDTQLPTRRRGALPSPNPVLYTTPGYHDIYIRRDRRFTPMGDRLPETLEACRSVAQLIVMHEMEQAGLFQPPDGQ